jgi:hypothetical protein
MNCFNRFGESLLHMDCRRGFEDTVEFLLDQPEVDVRICDDNGRTILHVGIRCLNLRPVDEYCNGTQPCFSFRTIEDVRRFSMPVVKRDSLTLLIRSDVLHWNDYPKPSQ